jgi:gliding motility-associated-like protein
VEVELDENLPIIVFADADTLNCRNQTIVLSAAGSSMSPSIEYTWTGPQDAIVSDPSLSEIEVNAPGVYELTLFDESNNCEASAQIEVREDVEVPNIEVVPPAEFNCEIGELTLDASASSVGPDFSYQWTTSDGNIVSGANSLTPSVQSGGTYILVITNERNGCTSSEEVVVESNFELPELDLPEEVDLTCRDSVLTLEVQVTTGGPYGLEWVTSDGNIVGNTDVESIDVNAPGTYTVQVIDSLSFCTNEVSVRVVDQRELPAVSISTPRELSCIQQEVQVSATVSNEGEFQYIWTTDEGIITEGEDAPIISVSAPGWYYLEVENTLTGCIARDSMEVFQVDNDFEGYSLEVTDALCIGDERGCVRIDSIQGGEAPYQMSINGNLFTPADREPCNVPIGENTILLRDANGCEIEYTFELNPPENYLVDLGEDLVFRNPSTDTLGYATDLPEEIITDQQWFINDSLFCRGCEDVIIDVSEDYLVNLKLFYADGDCFIEDVLHILYADELDVFVPNVFSPNGDGRNDFFTIFGDEKVVSITSLLIFDRWGTQLWEGRSLTPGNEPQGWDGSYKGEIVPPGVYVYTAEIRLNDGSTKRLQGSVTLSR